MELEKLDISTVFSSLIAGSIPVPCSKRNPLELQRFQGIFLCFQGIAGFKKRKLLSSL